MLKWKYLFAAILPVLILGCKKQNIEQAKEPEISVEANLATPALTKFSNVVILGNSITYAGPNIPLGWYGNWGMAASAEEKDYVHILTNCLKLRNPDVIVNIKNIAEFEQDLTGYDFDANLKNLRDSKPDLVILRIGEDVYPTTDLSTFEKRYTDLINYFKVDNPKVIILGASTVWDGVADKVMAKYQPCVSLKTITLDLANLSIGLFENHDVSYHPSDTGMRNIASIIWLKLKTLN